ncbi:MAG: hypothetical protein ACOYL6_16025 [Bacteriovoracaceae bacterium]
MEKYVQVPIPHLMRYQQDFHFCEIYIRLSEEKFIKLTQKEDGYADTLTRYANKGLTEIYLLREDFQAVFSKMKNKMADPKFPGANVKPAQKVEILSDSLKMAKDCLSHFGVNEEAMDVCKKVSDQGLKMVKEKGNIFKFLKDFQNNCGSEFKVAIATSHMMTLVIDLFMWKSLSIKEKASMAAILCDVTLKAEDFEILKKCGAQWDKLPEHIFKHPINVAAMLTAKRDLVAAETITIIEQHHELPDGTGFPYKHSHQRITQLSAIFIVCHDFIERLNDCDFDYSKQEEILTELFNYYDVGTYAKAFESLYKVAKIPK